MTERWDREDRGNYTEQLYGHHWCMVQKHGQELKAKKGDSPMLSRAVSILTMVCMTVGCNNVQVN